MGRLAVVHLAVLGSESSDIVPHLHIQQSVNPDRWSGLSTVRLQDLSTATSKTWHVPKQAYL